MNKQFNQRRFNIAPTSSISLYLSLLSIKIRTLLAFAVLLTTVIFIQSCEKTHVENLSEKEKKVAIEKFEVLVKEALPGIKSAIVNSSELCITEGSNSDKNFAFKEEAAKEAIKPLVQGTKELLEILGIPSQYLEKEFKDKDDPRIALIGLAILAGIDAANEPNGIVSLFDIFIKNAKAQDAFDCAIRSLGIKAFTELVHYGFDSELGKAALKSGIRKIASRTLGVIGVAWAAYEFGDCMGWF